jgi:hypothetical protein
MTRGLLYALLLLLALVLALLNPAERHRLRLRISRLLRRPHKPKCHR